MSHLNELIPISMAQHTTVPLSLTRRGGDDVERMLNRLMERLQSSPPSASWSCQAYDRLLAGETVSWLQILQDHPLLGSITVTKLIEAGVVQATPAVDARSATTDVWLTLQSRVKGEGERASEVAGARGF
ncbi:MAG TPA: hypothetical protein VHG52_00525 [Thermomicrobiales bacterium]|nr:hypothetical protein [Thermomicrobiales bacterium]